MIRPAPEYRGPEFKTMDRADRLGGLLVRGDAGLRLPAGPVRRDRLVVQPQGQLPDSRRFWKLAMPAASLLFIARPPAGFTEMGRQPWVVLDCSEPRTQIHRR